MPMDQGQQTPGAAASHDRKPMTCQVAAARPDRLTFVKFATKVAAHLPQPAASASAPFTDGGRKPAS